MREVITIILLAAGGVLQLIAVLGLCAMRSVYDRLHYVGLASYGLLLIAVAVLVRQSFSLIGDKALLVAAIAVLGGPVLVQSTVRSLLIREHGDYRKCTGEDDR